MDALVDIECYIDGSITRSHPAWLNLETFNEITLTQIGTTNIEYGAGTTLKWVFVAEGYKDIVVEVKIP